MSYASDAEIAFAAAMAHRLETSLLSARLERMVALLREHGIEPPRDDPRVDAGDHDHLIACRAVVLAAYELLERLEELRGIVGTGMELVGGQRWREARDGEEAEVPEGRQATEVELDQEVSR